MIHRKSHYGGKQDEYLKKSREIVSKVKESIQEAVKSKQDLQALFSELLSKLALERRQIALEHESPGGIEFGRRRDLDGKADIAYTFFAAGYQEYGHRILVLLKNILSQMEQDATHFKQKKYSKQKCCLGRKSSIEVEVFEKEDIKKLKWFEPFGDEIPEYFPGELVNKRNLSLEESTRFLKALRRLKKEAPEKFERLSKGSELLELQSYYPSPIKVGKTEEDLEWVGSPSYFKSLYVVATISFEIRGEMLPIYQYVTWLYRDPEHPEEDLLERMVLHSIPMVVHQYESYLGETLEDMGRVFEEMIRWNGKDLFELKKLMALFRYGLVSMPFARGTAAITEWFESAIYGYHHIQFQSDEGRMADLEAYVHPFFSDFLDTYNSMYELKFILPEK
jgi:hypothetical protein